MSIAAIAAALFGGLFGGKGDGAAVDPAVAELQRNILGEQSRRMLQQSGLYSMATNLAGNLMPRSASSTPAWPSRTSVNTPGGGGGGSDDSDRPRRDGGGGLPTIGGGGGTNISQVPGRGYAPAQAASLFRLSPAVLASIAAGLSRRPQV